MKKFAVFAGLALLVAVWTAAAADVSGTWKSKFETPRGTRERTYVLKQEGDKLTGKIITPRGETEIKEGKVSGDEIEFKAEQRRGPDAEPITVLYKAKVSGDKLEGTMQMGEKTVPFTATREK